MVFDGAALAGFPQPLAPEYGWSLAGYLSTTTRTTYDHVLSATGLAASGARCLAEICPNAMR